MDIKEFCRKLDRLLESRNLKGEGLETAIKAICQGLNVNAGDVALLIADEKAEALYFLWPKGLQKSGTVPFSSKDSLAVRTYLEAQAVIDNHFSATRHTSIFEALPLTEQGGKALPIQKIMSVPVHTQDECYGVLQVCRKAIDHDSAGPDFTNPELLEARLVARTLARHL